MLLVTSSCAQTAGGAGGSSGGGSNISGKISGSRRGMAQLLAAGEAPSRRPMRFYPTMAAPTGQNVRRGASLPISYYTITPQSAHVADSGANELFPSNRTIGSESRGSESSGNESSGSVSAPGAAGAAGNTQIKPFAGPIGISPGWDSFQCRNSPYCGVMYAPIKVYVIWYGKFTATQKELVRAFTRSLSPSSDPSITVPLWWNINRLYYDRNGRFISSSVTFADETADTGYSRGSSLSDSEIDSLVSSAINGQNLPYDPNGVYFVLSDETVGQSSQGSAFCTHYCGWHTYTDVSGKGRVVSSWVGNARSKCPGSCIASLISSSSASPNRDKGMDGLLSVYAHELAEATSSPYLLTWMDGEGEENADKCGWKFGTVKRDSSNAPFNLVGVNGKCRPVVAASGVSVRASTAVSKARFRCSWGSYLRSFSLPSFPSSNHPHERPFRATPPSDTPSPEEPAFYRQLKPPPAEARIRATRPPRPSVPRELRASTMQDPDQMAFCAASPAHCGVMHAPVGVYLVWYGAKFSEKQKDIVRLFIASLSSDASNPDATVPAWWAVNTLYFDQQGRNISSNVTIKGETHDTKYTRGTMLLRSDVAGLVQSAVGNGSLPYDPDGVYFVLSDEDVSQMDDPSGTGGAQYALAFCSHYCGWHSFTQGKDGRPLIISFVGNAVNQCPEGCIPPYLNQPGAVAPNGDTGMDGMVSVLAHELAEATSSPFLATWFDDQGEENADICSSSYGDVISDAATGVQYNIVGQNGARFLVQANLDPRAGSCVIAPVAIDSPILLSALLGGVSSASPLFPSIPESGTLREWSSMRRISRISYAPIRGSRISRRSLTEVASSGGIRSGVEIMTQQTKLPHGVRSLIDNSAQVGASSTNPAPKNIGYHWDDPSAAYMCSANAKYCGVMHEPIAVYLVWYGQFTEAQKQIMRTFIESLSSSNDTSLTVPKWWNINRLYYDAQGNYISGSVTLKGEIDDTRYSKGTTLYNSGVADLVSSAVNEGKLPYDSNGVYFVLGDSQVAQEDDSSYSQSGFCSSYCGWHAYTHDNLELVISFVGNAVTRCPEGCIPPYLNQPGAVAPNGDAGMDGMVSVLAHELAEATSSPFLATWFDDQGEENADICAGEYGDVTQDATTGAYFNLEGVRGSKFIVQANLDPVTGRCVVQSDGPEALGSPSQPPSPAGPTPSPPPVSEPPVTIPTPQVTVPTPPETVPEPPTVATPEPPVTGTPTGGSTWDALVSFFKSLFGF
ncbi:unnamed protein product [Closterium sp. Yama58-4]|nr:unnamed protein product [Closterium sp. Yama58-4]